MFDDFALRSNNVFTGKLIFSALKQDIEGVGQFCGETLEGLSQPLEESDRRVETGTWSEDREMRALAEVKTLMAVVKDKHEVTETLLDRCKVTCSYMKRIGRNVGPLVGVLKQASKDWQAILGMIPELEDTMKPLIKKNGVKVRAMIATYKLELEEFKRRVNEGEGFKEYRNTWAGGLQTIKELEDRVEAEEAKCDSMSFLANAFNCPREMGEAVAVIRDVKDVLEAFKKLWEVDKEVRFLMEMATEMQWRDLDPSGLDDLGRSVLKKAKKCPDDTLKSDAFKGLQEFARCTTCYCCSLFMDLS